ncbi:MAG: hypothetical protein INF48_11380 [Rhodobacter sp.]|nr:hypothetical protein [Rhodobacter sp.]
MSASTRALFALCLVAFAAACAPRVEEVVVEPVPITSEPASSGKYN